MPERLLHQSIRGAPGTRSEENPIIVSIEPLPREIVARILSAMNMAKAVSREQTSLQLSGAEA